MVTRSIDLRHHTPKLAQFPWSPVICPDNITYINNLRVASFQVSEIKKHPHENFGYKEVKNLFNRTLCEIQSRKIKIVMKF